MGTLWRRIKAALETAEHIHFIDMLVRLLFDWRTYVLLFLGAPMTFIWAALANRSPLDVWVLALNVLAALLLISLAVTLAWKLRRISRQSPTDAIQRMPIIDFVKLAEKAGWRVAGEHNLEAVDLMEFLIQAGCDGRIRFWGRLDNSQRLRDSPLVQIDKEHWQAYEFDWASVLHAKRNMQTRTYRFFSNQNRFATGYIDIRLDLDVPAAKHWLATEYAVAFKGQREQEERQKRRATTVPTSTV